MYYGIGHHSLTAVNPNVYHRSIGIVVKKSTRSIVVLGWAVCSVVYKILFCDYQIHKALLPSFQIYRVGPPLSCNHEVCWNELRCARTKKSCALILEPSLCFKLIRPDIVLHSLLIYNKVPWASNWQSQTTSFNHNGQYYWHLMCFVRQTENGGRWNLQFCSRSRKH